MNRRFDPRELVADAFPHPVSQMDIVETHISWVVLTGSTAYKFKKPVDFGFVDFSSLEKRREACVQELRLNSRSAPGIYLGLVAVVAADDGVVRVADGDCPDRRQVFEYGIRMREFAQSAQLDRQFEAGLLTDADMGRVAAMIAGLHESAAIAGAEQPWGEPQTLLQPVLENFRHLHELGGDERPILDQLQRWSEAEFAARQAVFRRRKREGRVRECHGDLHLSNLVRIGSGIVAFDCIEFDPALRWIDVLSDVAFLHMDLMVRQRADLAFGFLNSYLERGGDYGGIAVLPFYLSYRSMVRAKVAALQMLDESLSDQRRRLLDRRRNAHLRFAGSLVDGAKPRLVLMHGLSGSGKTWLSEQLLRQLPALRIRSDVERKRLHGLDADATTRSAPRNGIYSGDATRRTYQHLLDCAHAMLTGGCDVIVDAAFLEEQQRVPFIELAARHDLPCVIIACEAPLATLRQRLIGRSRQGRDASEASLEVLASQLARSAAIPATTAAKVVRVETGRTVVLSALCQQIRDGRAG